MTPSREVHAEPAGSRTMAILTQGPDTNPTTPRFRCPPGTIDSHIHLFGPEAQYPFAPETYYTSRDQTAEMHAGLMAKLGSHA